LKVSILTLGCKTNLSESDLLKAAALGAGYQLVELTEHPDICIINTCTVTSKADYQSRQLLRRAIKAGAKKIIVTGCYAQLEPETLQQLSANLKIIPINKKNLIYKEINLIPSSTLSNIPRARPFVKIQEGCDFRCSYCIVWKARGRARSRDIEEIVNEVKVLEESGYLEVVLTGTHIGLYGKDLKHKVSLYDLIVNILKKTKKIRIRLSSLESHEIDDRLIELLQEKRFCRHLHIPIQSGDDKILSLMKRPYTVKDYLKTIDRILAYEPETSIGTDVIVGFPGEGIREFLNTLTLIEKTSFSYLHIFPYSPRPKTLAAKLPGQVSKEEKKKRVSILKDVDKEKRKKYREKFIEKTLQCVYEKQAEEGMYLLRADNYIKLYVSNNNHFSLDSLVLIKCKDVYKDGLLGEPIVNM